MLYFTVILHKTPTRTRVGVKSKEHYVYTVRTGSQRYSAEHYPDDLLAEPQYHAEYCQRNDEYQ